MYAYLVGEDERSGVVKKALMALALVASLLLLVMGTALPAQAQSSTTDITVNSALDNTTADGKCTLREAINNANSDSATSRDCATGSGADTITFNLGSSATITLGSTLPSITDGDGLSIDGGQNQITVSGNNAVRVLQVGSGARLDLKNLTVAKGHTSGNGGGIDNREGGTLEVTNSTFSNNSASQSGGGIDNFQGTLTMSNSTFSQNSAQNAGGGILNYKGTATFNNTIVANSTGPNCSGSITDGGGNLDDGTTCQFSSASKSNADDGLDDGLKDNGGPTQTIALMSDSAAIDAVVDDNCPATDQRGVSRPQGAGCDIGAFEVKVFTVTSTGDSVEEGTLRAAITAANASPGADAITFNIPGDGPHTITPNSQLPTITDPVTIDGYTQPGASANTLATGNDAALKVVLHGSGAGFDGLVISSKDTTVKGLVINNFRIGVYIKGAGATGNAVEGNYLGTDDTGTKDLGNSNVGVQVENAPGNTVGGTEPAARNVISGNNIHGIYIVEAGATGNEVLGNYIGTDATGTKDLGNTYDGVDIETPDNTVGGTEPGARNIISGNGQHGVYINGVDANSNEVLGNYIGTEATGTKDLGNSQDGIQIHQSKNNMVGGTEAGARNIISGNDRFGIVVLNDASGNSILNNSIFANSNLGIDLVEIDSDGVTPNDNDDPDSGPNNRQNFPIIESATSAGGAVTVKGKLDSTPHKSFVVEVFRNSAATGPDPSGYGEGETLVNRIHVPTGANGEATFSVTDANGDTNATYTATATNEGTDDTSEFGPAREANTAPLATDQTATTDEDKAVNVILRATDADRENLSFEAVAPNNGTLGAITSVDCPQPTTLDERCASVTYTPNANYYGSDSFTYKVTDGQKYNDTATVSISINPVNDAPGFTKGADQTVNEDAVAQSVSNWATNISAGPSNESGQQVSFDVTNNNPTLFSAAPQIAPDGTLTYTPAKDAYGSATVSVKARDDGGTDNGGVDTSTAQTFTISINPVNDAPSFTPGADVSVAEDSSAYSSAWATGISKGAANEAGQSLTFDVTATNQTLFSAGPQISPDGKLSFTPAKDAYGSATVSVTATDNGGTADGGQDKSSTATFTITVTPVNDAPTAAVAAGGSCSTMSVSGAMNLTLADVDSTVGGLTLSASSSNTTLVPVANVKFGGSGANRTVTITPAATKSGSANITITASDGTTKNTTEIKVVVGTDQKETINGTGTDMIFGQNGDDTINAGDGNDLVCGGNAGGVISGGAGDDTLDGGNGNDTLRGDTGKDIVRGSAGNDTLTGGTEADSFDGGSGTDSATDYNAGEGDTRTNIP